MAPARVALGYSRTFRLPGARNLQGSERTNVLDSSLHESAIRALRMPKAKGHYNVIISIVCAP
jgi:hypothetical protein